MRQMGFGHRGFPWRVGGIGMRGWRARRRGGPVFLCMALVVVMGKWLIGGCDGRQGPPPPSTSSAPGAMPAQATSGDGRTIALPDAEQRVCTAVAILIDTSGSMEQRVRGSSGGQQQK